MSDENEECPKCNSMKVRHDRVKGNVKCFSCGYVVESHYQTFEQEVNNYENDPDQMNKMRGLVQDGKDFKIKIGKEVVDEQTGKKKKRGDDEERKKEVRKQLQKWCDHLKFEKREIFEIESYYNILLNMDTGSSATGQKEANYPVLKRRAVVAMYIFIRLLKLEENYFNLDCICNLASVSVDDVRKELENIKNNSFEDKEKIVDILFEKRDLKSYAEDYAKQSSLSENDKKGYLALCQQIKESEISNGEQDQTKAAAALYAVFKLSNNPDLNNKNLKDLSTISQKSDGTIKKFFDGALCPNIGPLLEGIKYQQFNWKHYSELKKS